MAWPVITDHFAAQVTHMAPSGLPTDVFTNVWYFRNDGIAGQTPVSEAITRALQAFYFTAHNGSFSVATWMPNMIAESRVKVYDLGMPTPRYPIHDALLLSDTDWDTTGNSTEPLPRELAVCLSYHTDVPGARNRGRLFLGPFVVDALDAPTADQDIRVDPQVRETIALAAENVLGTSENITWVMLSMRDAATKVITGGWVDDAWDIQRRRGAAPSTRRQWGVAIA